jgi:hypothetical protein
VIILGCISGHRPLVTGERSKNSNCSIAVLCAPLCDQFLYYISSGADDGSWQEHIVRACCYTLIINVMQWHCDSSNHIALGFRQNWLNLASRSW